MERRERQGCVRADTETSAPDKWERKPRSGRSKGNRRGGRLYSRREKLAEGAPEPTACSLPAPVRVLLELSPVSPGRRPTCHLQITGPGENSPPQGGEKKQLKTDSSRGSVSLHQESMASSRLGRTPFISSQLTSRELSGPLI